MSTAQEEFNAFFSEKQTSRRHPEDSTSETSDPSPEPGTFHEYDDLDQPAPQRDARSRYYIPRQRSKANTGPKGVIADAQAFEAARRTQKRVSAVQRGPAAREAYRGVDGAEEELLGSGDEGDADFMERWRQGRLRELQRGGQGSGSPGRGKRVYGALVAVDGEGYLDAVERSPAGTVVVVFIYDDRSEISEMVEECVRVLARTHKTTRFVKLSYEEAEMEVAGVPAILAYRGGEKFAGLVPVVDEIPDDAELDATSLEAVLKRHQILI